ncbi:MAG TPA: hypothetical protein VJ464_04370 [Blastocatellia bacterium]|nr:hypothetical protein [Blastocatellia bacterium]
MEPRIGHWHCRYRLIGARQEAALAVERLERTVRPRVSAAYADALAHAFENDPAVYCLRRLNVRLVLDGAMAETEANLARRWADRLGSAVVTSIARDGDHSDNLVRFMDEPDYVAHFLLDLLNDMAWQRWYYGAFSKLRGRPKKEAVLFLLMEHREHLSAILRRLAILGCLSRVLALIDEPAARALWSEAGETRAELHNADGHRIFVRSAIHILRLLGVWPTSAPSESAVLEEYLKNRPLMPDWTDRRSLAAAVLNVIRHATDRAYVSGLNSETAEKLPEIGEQISSEFDWLDVEWLCNALFAILAKTLPELRQSTLPSRNPAATPLHRQIVERIRDLLRAGKVRLNLNEADTALNAIRLYAALAAADPELASRAAARAVIDHLLICARSFAEASGPHTILAAMRMGGGAPSFAILPRRAQDALNTAASYGPAAVEALEEIIASRVAGGTEAFTKRFQTECAGLFLAARAIIDARITQVATACGAGPVSSVLLAIGIVWMGPRALRDTITDEGLAFWCGLAPEEHCATEMLAALDVEGCHRLLVKVRELFEDRAALYSSLKEIAAPESCLADLIADLPPGVIVNESLALTAIYAIRLWAQWLPGLSGSSPLYLLRNMLRRAGALQISDHCVDVRLQPGPFDVVLEMASYTKELSGVTWLGGRKVIFHIERSSE